MDLNTLEAVLATVGLVVTAATLIVKGLEIIAGITPTTKDDEVVGKIKGALSRLSGVLSAVSVAKPGSKPNA